MAKGVSSPEPTEIRGGPADYEEAIRKIRGVMAARVVAGAEGTISEIHVLAGPDRGPKQVVRDVESSLMAQFSLPVDHKRISVAQVDGSEPVSWGNGRLQLVNVRFASDRLEAEAEVGICYGGVTKEGTRRAPASTLNRLRVTAEATLGALTEFFSPDYRLSLDDVAITTLATNRICLVALSLLTPEGEEALAGSSMVREDEALAVARAVLDAMNRRFTVIAGKSEARTGGNVAASSQTTED